MNERIAQEGYWLTQATLTDEAGRTFARRVCGFGDLDALYTEWTDAQKAEWEATPHEDEEIPPEEALSIITGEAL